MSTSSLFKFLERIISNNTLDEAFVVTGEAHSWAFTGIDLPLYNNILGINFDPSNEDYDPNYSMSDFCDDVLRLQSDFDYTLTVWACEEKDKSLQKALKSKGFQNLGIIAGLSCDPRKVSTTFQSPDDLKIKKVAHHDIPCEFMQSDGAPNLVDFSDAAEFTHFIAFYKNLPCGLITLTNFQGHGGLFHLHVLPNFPEGEIKKGLLLTAFDEAKIKEIQNLTALCTVDSKEYHLGRALGMEVESKWRPFYCNSR